MSAKGRKQEENEEDLKEEEDDDEEEDQEDQEEEEEEEDERSRKRRGASANIYFDEEAKVDNDADEEEDEYEEDDFIEGPAAESDDEVQAPRSSYRQVLRRLTSEDNEDDDYIEEKIKKLEEQHEVYLNEDYDDVEERSDVRQQSYLPDINSPKLWLVRCKPGKEREAIFSIMKRAFEKEGTDDKFEILSAIASDTLKGYIYIESRKEVFVKKALENISIVFENSCSLVPINDMVDVLKVSKKVINLPKNSWVRVNRGSYKGDLGQVIHFDQGKLKAVIKLIPRLDIFKKNTIETSFDHKKRKRAASAPPPARFFVAQEIRDLGGEVTPKVENGEEYELYDGNKFKNGYLLKSINIKSFEYENIQPTLDQIQRFKENEKDLTSTTTTANHSNALDHLDLQSLRPSTAGSSSFRKLQFTKGEKVRVIRGEQTNLIGTVKLIEDDGLTIEPLLDSSSSSSSSYFENNNNIPVKVSYEDVEKLFEAGDHVKVIGGRYQGETGLIVHVSQQQQSTPIITIFSDLTKTQIQVLSRDVQECTDIASGKLQLGAYELHDLVLLNRATSFQGNNNNSSRYNNNAAGVIVKIERDSFQVLDNNGSVQNIRLQEMGKKKNDRNASSLDRNHNQVVIGDLIEVTEGANTNRQGTIKHLFHSYAFIHARDCFENSGIFVAKTSSCQLLGTNKRINLPSFDPSRNRGRGGRDNRGGANNRGRSFVHKTVTIKAGPWKGYVGIVTDETEHNVRVELHTKCKTVTVEKGQFNVRGEEQSSLAGNNNNNNNSSSSSNSTSSFSESNLFQTPDTPQHGSRTPMRDGPGSSTPLRMATPMRMSTPSHDAWNPRLNTPSRDTPNWIDDFPNRKNFASPFSPYGTETPQETSFSSNTSTPGYNDPSYREYHSSFNDLSPESPYTSTQNYPATPTTPMGPTTPGTPGGLLHESFEEVSNEAEQPWQTTNIEVQVTSDSFLGGQYKNRVGVIQEVQADGSCKLTLLSPRETILIPGEFLEPVLPKKSDKIKVIRGPAEFLGVTGELLTIDGTSGIVRVDTSARIRVINLNHLAKCH